MKPELFSEMRDGPSFFRSVNDFSGGHPFRARFADANSLVATSSAKRMLDIAVAALLLLALCPLMLIVAVLIRLETKGPVIFRQKRTGLGGETFWVLKFRTMTVEENGPEIRHATKNDDRVTRVGAILRRSSIDELPQLFNILNGHMSLVGPRPHAVAHDNLYGAALPHYHRRFAAKPGLTGLAQIKGLRGEIHSLGCMDKRISADCEYIHNWTVARDLMIVAMTVPALFSKSAY